MITDNTMSSAIEAMEMTLPGSSTMAAEVDEKEESAAASARVLVQAIKEGLRPRQVLTRQAFENAIAVVMAVGGSPNPVLHLLAIPHPMGAPLIPADFEPTPGPAPRLCALKPAGR